MDFWMIVDRAIAFFRQIVADCDNARAKGKRRAIRLQQRRGRMAMRAAIDKAGTPDEYRERVFNHMAGEMEGMSPASRDRFCKDCCAAKAAGEFEGLQPAGSLAVA